MRVRRHREKGFWQDNQGFTLVELILTIAILAIVTIPILSYFTDAAKHNANSRLKQNASVLAQDILENFKNTSYSLDDPSVVCSAQPQWSTKNAPDADGVYTLSQQTTVDKNSFQVEAEITPVKEVTKTVPADSVEYHKFVIGTMDTSKDVLSSEHGQTLLAAGLVFAGKHSTACAVDGSATELDSEGFQQCLDCTIVISAEQDTEKAGYDIIRVIYRYTFNAGRWGHGGAYPKGIDSTFNYEETVQSSSIQVSKLENIYIFYNPISTEDTIAFETNDGNAIENSGRDLNLFVIAQSSVPEGTNAADIPAGYTVRPVNYKLKLNSAGTGFADRIQKFYTNLSKAKNELDGSDTVAGKVQTDSTGNNYTLVHTEDINRLADITITVKSQGSATTKAGDTVVQVQGAKLQN